MGLFDYLKARVGVLKGKGSGHAEAIAEPLAARLKLEEVERFLAGREREELERAVEKARGPIEQVESEIRELRKKIEEFSKKEPNSEHRFYKIANQMKQGFDSRSAKLFVSLDFPKFAEGKKPFFSEVTKFQARLLTDLQIFSKTALDNKYLPEFFNDDTAEFSLLVKRISALTKELDAALAPAKKRQPVFSLCRKSLENVFLGETGVDELEKSIYSSKGRVEEAVKQLEACKKKLVKLGGQEFDGADRKLSGLRAKRARLFAELMHPLSVLQRPFRKLERICKDKGLRKIFRNYSSNPWSSLLADSVPETLDLRKACSFLLESAEELEKDEGAGRKIRSAAERLAGGACSPLLTEFEELNRQEKELKKEAAPLVEALESKELAGKKLREWREQLKQDEASLKLRQKELKAAKLELEGKLSGLVNAKVTLS